MDKSDSVTGNKDGGGHPIHYEAIIWWTRGIFNISEDAFKKASNISVSKQPLAATTKIWKKHSHFTPLIADVPLIFNRWKLSSSSVSGCQIGQPDETGREEVLLKTLRDDAYLRAPAFSEVAIAVWLLWPDRGNWSQGTHLYHHGRKPPSPLFHEWGNLDAERESNLSMTWNVVSWLPAQWSAYHTLMYGFHHGT